MKIIGPFKTFQHKTIIRNQIAFMNHSQYPVRSSRDTFYVQDTFVSLEGLEILPSNGFFLMFHRPWFGTTFQIFRNFEQRFEILIKIFYFWWNLQWNESRPYLKYIEIYISRIQIWWVKRIWMPPNLIWKLFDPQFIPSIYWNPSNNNCSLVWATFCTLIWY